MGFRIVQKLECDCVGALKECLEMKRIALKQVGETSFQAIYQCPHCNRNIRVSFKITYQDYNKGLIVE